MCATKGRWLAIIRAIEKKTVLIAIVIVFAIAYYINPLANVELSKWDRTFCSAVLAGISIDARIENFYKLLLFELPLLTVVVTCVLGALFKSRECYIEIYEKWSIFLFLVTFASHISRYTADGKSVNENPMLLTLLCFFLVLYVIALIDKKQKICFKDSVILFVSYIISVATFAMLFHAKNIVTYILCIGVVLVLLVILLLNAVIGNKCLKYLRCFAGFITWLPLIIRVVLEGIYILTENGYRIERYSTYIGRATLIVIVFFSCIAGLVYKKKRDFSVLGYIGAIVSLTSIGYFSYSYQYIFSYSNMANVYELGNNAVAMDSYLYGKLPIIDYFSAHALGDIWTQLIYCFVNRDINGILVNPYEGLGMIIAFIALFMIIKHIFNEDIAVIYVMLFPGMLIGIKWVSVCSISIVALIYILKAPSVKAYVIFWISILVSAFYTYDEGISLGVACIIAYIIECFLSKKWKEIRQFVLAGTSVGAVVLFFYISYAMITGLPVVGRVKEWIAVSVKSSSTWAIADFGDYTSYAFFVSYFIVPAAAVMILIFSVARYIKTKKNMKLVAMIIAFSMTEILYITRMIVYHNLAICSGTTGVLLNFIHWTVSVYILFWVTGKEWRENAKVFAFTGVMMAVILVEGTAVTQNWPSADSTLVGKSLKAADSWDLSDNMSCNIGQPRIIYDEKTTVMVNSFRNIFNALMSDNQTFLDFANVSSLYLLTGRTRPCYVGQSPSLLTDLYSQRCFLEEIKEYDCPLAVLGTTETSYLQQMVGIPHNVRYYKIAEYIYTNYRPLIKFGEFVIWCKNGLYNEYIEKLTIGGFTEFGCELVDYGYDFTVSNEDEYGNLQPIYAPYHEYDLQDIPYIWANYDNYNAIGNKQLTEIVSIDPNVYFFEGSKKFACEDGNYLECSVVNTSKDDINIGIIAYDSGNEGAKMHFLFNVKPGKNDYLIRISEDYFWNSFNIDSIIFESCDLVEVQEVGILEGD